MKKILPGFLACIMLAMLLAGSAQAADDTAAKRQADLDYLYTTLREEHPSLFANTSEEAFLARKAEIEQKLSTEGDFEFALDCQSLAALAGDSHTTVSLGAAGNNLSYWLFDMDYYGGKWILTVAGAGEESALGSEITAINGISMDEVVSRFGKILSSDNPVRLRNSFWSMCYVSEVYDYLGLSVPGEPLTLSIVSSSGEARTITAARVPAAEYRDAPVASLYDKVSGKARTAYDKSKIYTGFPLSDSVYYIQYNSCREDENLSMEDFCTGVSADLAAGDYSLILVDMRNNGGGGDGVIIPLLDLLCQEREKGTAVAGLIGRKTFSSAIINSVEMQEMGFPLLGENTIGSVDHFGAVNSFVLPNSGLRLGISSKFISMSGYFDAAAGKGVESLQPDVCIEQTLADYIAGRDTCVEAILADPGIVKADPRSAAPMTRARFVGRLYALSGAAASSVQAHPFADSLDFEWYVPALCWAKESGVAQGCGDGGFASARAITWQEAAVFAYRAASALKLAPANVRSTPLPEALSVSAWNEEAVRAAWSWGILPEAADYSVSPTRSEAEALLTALIK